MHFRFYWELHIGCVLETVLLITRCQLPDLVHLSICGRLTSLNLLFEGNTLLAIGLFGKNFALFSAVSLLIC